MLRSVHGEGDRNGLTTMLVAADRQLGTAAYVGDGQNRWPVLPAGPRTGTDRVGPARGRRGHRGPDRPPGRPGRPGALGVLGALLGGDQPASNAVTRKLVGWKPTGPTLLEDGYYTASQSENRRLPESESAVQVRWRPPAAVIHHHSMTDGPWTGNDETHNDACHQRWLRDRHRVTGDETYAETWYAQQCGGCRYWIALDGRLGADYGACTNAGSPFDARIRFEHDGCKAYTGREDASFG